MKHPGCYFDHDGSSPVRPEVAEAMADFASGGPANPTGIHFAARRARAILERARRELAQMLALPPAGLLFTGSGVEVLATALYGRLGGGDRPSGARIVASSTERPEVLEMLDDLERRGAHCRRVPLRSGGRIDLDAWEEALGSRADLAILHHACHETGVLQPVEEAAALCRRAGTPLLLDATGSFCRTELPPGLGERAGLVAMSGHRGGGPAGVGLLLVRPDLPLRPLIPGAGERGRRGGMEHVAGAVGLAALAGIRRRTGREEDARVRRLRDGFERGILDVVPDCTRNGGDPRLPGTSNLSFPGLEGEALAIRLDLEGMGVSVGAACSSGSTRPGHVLPAMGLDVARVRSSVRISLGWCTRPEEVEDLMGALPPLVAELRAAHPRRRVEQGVS